MDDVDFTLNSGELVGLIGPNGAGKTTLFSIISGIQEPTEGQVLLRDVTPRGQESLVTFGMARTFQHVQLVADRTVLENVALGAFHRTGSGFVRSLFGLDYREEARALATAAAALDRVGLSEDAHRPAGSLPLGRQRIVEIARALAAGPDVLLLDEPAAGLRLAEKVQLVRLLRQLKSENVTILLVEHDMDLVMSCVDRLVLLDRGRKIAEGAPASIQKDPAVIAAYLGGGHVQSA